MTLSEVLETELNEWGLRTEARFRRMLNNLGWMGTQIPREYRHVNAPDYSIDLDTHSPDGRPFEVFHRSRRIARVNVPPSIDDLSRMANASTN